MTQRMTRSKKRNATSQIKMLHKLPHEIIGAIYKVALTLHRTKKSSCETIFETSFACNSIDGINICGRSAAWRNSKSNEQTNSHSRQTASSRVVTKQQVIFSPFSQKTERQRVESRKK